MTADRSRPTVRIDLDRAIGALLGLAAGDALGAGYEFTRPTPDAAIVMEGGGVMGWPAGHWTDDTDQAVAIVKVLAEGRPDGAGSPDGTGSPDRVGLPDVVGQPDEGEAPEEDGHLDRIGQGFLDWYARGPRDVGISTSAVLGAAASAGDLPRSAAAYLAANPRSAAGNGSLMRTSPVAIAFAGDDAVIAREARAVSDLTHADPLAGDACVLWCIAIDRAIRQQRLDGVRDGLALLPADRRDRWAGWIDEAETQPPATFVRNGYVVRALQAALSAIVHTPVPDDEPCLHLQHALETAVRIGDDTDTVAAIAGQLLGARWGMTAVPWRWRRLLHGTDPTTGERLDVDDLVRWAALTARGGRSDDVGWPSAARLTALRERHVWCSPLGDDPDLLVGNLPGLDRAVKEGVDAVVSLCRVGVDQVPDGVEHHQFRLIDKAGPSNANPGFVIDDAATAVGTLRAEGKRVYLHCLGGRSRTAAVAATQLGRTRGLSPAEALPVIRRSLPEAHLDVFGDVLDRDLSWEAASDSDQEIGKG